MLKNYRKVDVKEPAGATPYGHVAFVRFGAESCARRARNKMRYWVVNEANIHCLREARTTLKI